MMHLLGCLDRPTSGTFRLNNRNVSEMSDRELASVRNQYIGFVFQTFNLINRTPAVDNVAIPLFYARQANTRATARAALERVGLGHRWDHKPSELSGGERQRVAIARAIVNDPVLILADEPTGNLDTRTGEQIMQVFRTLNEQGVTVILVTHEQEVAMQARRIVHMRDGKIISDGPSSAAYEDPSRMTAGAKTAAHKHSGPLADLGALDPAIASTGTGCDPGGSGAPGTHSAATDYSRLPQRLMRGATTTVVLGALAITLLLTAVVLILIVTPQAAELQKSGVTFGPDNPPPLGIVLMSFGGMASILLGVISAVVAIFLDRGVRRRIRSEPGNWTGGRRARVGSILGWATILLPVLLLATQLIRAGIR
jgi:putative ABC transport system ATP-binding protein